MLKTPPEPSVILTLVIFILLTSLGAWQVQRLHWKEDLIAAITERMSASPVPLQENIDDPASLEFHRVTLVGRYLPEHVFLIKPRTLDGKNGYHMVMPLRRASGGLVFVNRGWVSDDTISKVSTPDGVVKVEGIIQAPHKAYFTPNNNPDKKDWYWPDIKAMAAATGLPDVLPVLVTVAASPEGQLPIGGQIRLDIPNDHKQYAIFWFGMSVVWLLMSWMYHRRKGDV